MLLVYHPDNSVRLLPYREYERLAESRRTARGFGTLKSAEITLLPRCDPSDGCVCDFLGAWKGIR